MDTSNGQSKQIKLSDCNDTNQFSLEIELIEYYEQIMQYCEPLPNQIYRKTKKKRTRKNIS